MATAHTALLANRKISNTARKAIGRAPGRGRCVARAAAWPVEPGGVARDEEGTAAVGSAGGAAGLWGAVLGRVVGELPPVAVELPTQLGNAPLRGAVLVGQVPGPLAPRHVLGQ